MDDLLFHNWVKVLLYLHNNNSTKTVTLWTMCKALDISSTSSVIYIIRIFEKKGLVKIGREGRNNSYILTPKGSRVAEYLTKVRAEL